MSLARRVVAAAAVLAVGGSLAVGGWLATGGWLAAGGCGDAAIDGTGEVPRGDHPPARVPPRRARPPRLRAGATEATPEPAHPPAGDHAASAPSVAEAPAPDSPPGHHGGGCCESRPTWFEQVQNADGSWGREQGWAGDAASTGLVLLAFLGAGETHQSGKCKERVKSALKWLRSAQRDDGTLGWSLRDHAIAALALTEAYGMTQSVLFKDPAARALRRAEERSRFETLDVETAAWLVLLFRSARDGEMETEPGRLEALRDRLADAPGAVPLGEWDDPLRAAAATLAIALTPEDSDAWRESLREAFAPVIDVVRKDPRRVLEREPLRHLTLLAAYRIGGDVWRDCDARIGKAVVDAQIQDEGPDRGTWEPRAEGIASHRVPATALATLSLEVYYRYSRVVGMR